MLVAQDVLPQEPFDGPPDMPIDGETRSKTIDTLLDRLRDHYVFPEKAAMVERAVRERAKNKEYDGITSSKALARKLTNDLQAVTHDKHLRVDYFFRGPPPEKRPEPTPEERERRLEFARRVNFGVDKAERLAGNIGYLELREFMPPQLAADAVAKAFDAVVSTDALIIDVRRNNGGSGEAVALVCSYLFGPEPIHLNTIHWRENDRQEQVWTQREVAGKRYTRKPVYVLTSRSTFSAAEEFSYNLKSLKRATIVGDATGGGAHPMRPMALGQHFGAMIPTGRSINPITKSNWEGTGVEPDVKVAAEQALKVAKLAAMRKVKEAKSSAELTREIEILEKELRGVATAPRPSSPGQRLTQ